MFRVKWYKYIMATIEKIVQREKEKEIENGDPSDSDTDGEENEMERQIFQTIEMGTATLEDEITNRVVSELSNKVTKVKHLLKRKFREKRMKMPRCKKVFRTGEKAGYRCVNDAKIDSDFCKHCDRNEKSLIRQRAARAKQGSLVTLETNTTLALPSVPRSVPSDNDLETRMKRLGCNTNPINLVKSNAVPSPIVTAPSSPDIQLPVSLPEVPSTPVPDLSRKRTSSPPPTQIQPEAKKRRTWLSIF